MWSVHLSAKPSKPCSFNPPTGIGRCKGKTIPDRLALTILVPCTFVLIRGGGDTPKESLGETGPFNHRVGNGVRVCSSGVLRRCVATALRKCSACNSSQRTGGKLTTFITNSSVHSVSCENVYLAPTRILTPRRAHYSLPVRPYSIVLESVVQIQEFYPAHAM